MNYTDIFMLRNVAVTVLVVLVAVIAKTVFDKKIYGQGVMIPLALLAYGALNFNDKLLEIAFWFSIPVAMMQIIADDTLTEMTLEYGGKSWKIDKTPWWMTALWIVALTQLSYFCLKLYSLGLGNNEVLSIFVPISFLYFFTFEVVVNNFTAWWKRMNCWQPLRVAVYALIAEFLTCVFLPIILKNATPNIFNISIGDSLLIGAGTGVFVLGFFVASCFLDLFISTTDKK